MVPVAVLPLGAIGPSPGLFSVLVRSTDPNEASDVLLLDHAVDHLHLGFVLNGSEVTTPLDAELFGIKPRECLDLDIVPALGCFGFGK